MRRPIFLLALTAAGSLLAMGACGDSETTTNGAAGTMTTGGNGGTPTTGGSGGTGGDGGSGGMTSVGNCVMPTPLAAGETVMGDTSLGDDAISPVLGGGLGPCQLGGAKEVVYSFEAAADGFVRFTLESDTDQGIYLREDCTDSATEFRCVDGAEGGMPEVLGLFVEVGQTFAVVVDGYEAGQEGPFSLVTSMVLSEEGMCQDGIDNNDDLTLIDCQDPSCFDDATCLADQATACAAAIPLTPGTPQADDTIGGSALFGTFDPICTALEGALTDVFSFTSAQDQLLGIQLVSATDQGFFTRTTCDDVSTQAVCRDAGFAGEDEFFVIPTQTGTSLSLFVAAYEPGEEGPYTLTSSLFPIGETEPNDTFDVADAFAGGEYGHLTGADDEDWFTLTLASTSDVTISTADVLAGDCAEGRVDTEIELFEDDGVTSVVANDDIDTANQNYCSSFTQAQVPAGTYVVRVRSSESFCPACEMAYRLDLAIAN